MEHLFAVWPEISERLRFADRVQLLSDFDGTLSPIVDRPEEAVLPEGSKQALRTLLDQTRVSIAVISGRSLDDIKNRVGMPGITYAGNHGIEIEGPWLKFVYPPAEATRPVMRDLYAKLTQVLSGFQGALVEDKGVTLTVHYRLVQEERVEELKSVCEDTVSQLRSKGKVRTTAGKKIYEIRPGMLWDKEDAIVLLLSSWSPSTGKAGGLSLFLGDDLTDEEGFKVMNRHGGVSIFVGEPGSTTAARYYLRSPDEVATFLRKTTEAVLALRTGPWEA